MRTPKSKLPKSRKQRRSPPPRRVPRKDWIELIPAQPRGMEMLSPRSAAVAAAVAVVAEVDRMQRIGMIKNPGTASERAVNSRLPPILATQEVDGHGERTTPSAAEAQDEASDRLLILVRKQKAKLRRELIVTETERRSIDLHARSPPQVAQLMATGNSGGRDSSPLRQVPARVHRTLTKRLHQA